MATSMRSVPLVERVEQEMERVSGEEHAPQGLGELARELQRARVAVEPRRRRSPGAAEDARDPRRSAGSTRR